MIQREQRRKNRIKNLQVKKLSLHSDENNSFLTNLSAQDAWEMLAKISKESWFLQTGQKAPDRLDKSIVKIISKEDRCI